MRHLIRWWMRRRFTKALDKADWRTSTLKPNAAYEVQTLRPKLVVEPINLNQGLYGVLNPYLGFGFDIGQTSYYSWLVQQTSKLDELTLYHRVPKRLKGRPERVPDEHFLDLLF